MGLRVRKSLPFLFLVGVFLFSLDQATYTFLRIIMVHSVIFSLGAYLFFCFFGFTFYRSSVVVRSVWKGELTFTTSFSRQLTW